MSSGFDAGVGGVETDVVVGAIAPGLTRVIAVIFAATAIDRANFATQLSIGEHFIRSALFAATRYAGVHIGVNKDTGNIFVAENVIGTTTNDYTRFFVSNLL